MKNYNRIYLNLFLNTMYFSAHLCETKAGPPATTFIQVQEWQSDMISVLPASLQSKQSNVEEVVKKKTIKNPILFSTKRAGTTFVCKIIRIKILIPKSLEDDLNAHVHHKLKTLKNIIPKNKKISDHEIWFAKSLKVN